MKYEIIKNNDGALSSWIVESPKQIKEICETEYENLIKEYRDDCPDFEIAEPWEAVEMPKTAKDNPAKITDEPESVTMGATIDYCMGHEYIYEISVKVTAAW